MSERDLFSIDVNTYDAAVWRGNGEECRENSVTTTDFENVS